MVLVIVRDGGHMVLVIVRDGGCVVLVIVRDGGRMVLVIVRDGGRVVLVIVRDGGRMVLGGDIEHLIFSLTYQRFIKIDESCDRPLSICIPKLFTFGGIRYLTTP